MPTIRNIHNSFVQFGGGGDVVFGSSPERDACFSGCKDPVSICLPMHEITDVAFQIVLVDFDATQRTNLRVALYKGSDCPADMNTATGTIIHYWTSAELELIALGEDYLLVFDVEEGLNLCQELQDSDCLHLVLYNYQQQESEVYACSNCFYFAANTCYTKLIRYRNLENAFGFYYEEADSDYYNKIRLNITSHSPQFPVTKNVFRLSDGSYKKLSAFLQKEYECLVDYLNENLHQSVVIALEHDFLYLYNEDLVIWEKRMNADGQEYKIDWLNKPGGFLHRGQAKFKLSVDPYYNQNSNC